MKYSSYIDNMTSKNWGLNVQQAYLFDWIYSLPSWATSMVFDGDTYYFASKTKAVDELPLLTDKIDTMYRHYKSLEDLGLIEVKKVDGKDYIRLTDKSKDWGRSDTSEKNPSLGKKSVKRSEKNPTYKTTISDKITRTDESNDSSFQNTLFEGNTPSKKKKERAREADECYPDFVKVWTEEYKILGFGAVDGKCIKDIIRLTKAHISGKDKLPTLETTVNMFKYVIAYVKRERHFCDGKPLTTWKSQYLSIIHEIANGKAKQPTYTDRIRSTNDIIRSL